MDIFLPQETLSAIKKCHVLVDTCFLLDFSSLKNKSDKIKLSDLLINFRSNAVSFITLAPVMKDLITQYGVYARGKLSYVDLCLATALKQFPNTYLLTRNYKDFPLKIFGCSGNFVLQFNNDLRTYCFYRGKI